MLSKIPTIEIFSPGEVLSPYIQKIMHDFTIVIINKSFEFQNDWFEIIRIRYNCMQFCPIPLCKRKQIFQITSEFLELYIPKSNQLQIT